MERDFNTSDFFGEPAFADVTIKFSGTELRPHKIILCTRSKDFERALKGEGFKEGKEGVLELHGDNPAALHDMLRYIYSSKYEGEASRIQEIVGNGSKWRRPLELAIVADKYGITGLKETALKRVGDSGLLRRARDIIRFTKRAREASIEQEVLDKIIYRDCEARFVTCFKYASFREWLQERPAIWDLLCEQNIQPLMKTAAFHSMLANDGELALKLLKVVINRHEQHLMSCTQACRGPRAMLVPLEADIETDEEAEEDGGLKEAQQDGGLEEELIDYLDDYD